jgi:hypothetical protein
MNFVFDSHWQQSRNVRWSYIWAKKLEVSYTHKHLQTRVAHGVVVKVLFVAHKIHGLRMGIQPAREWR